MDNLSKLHQNHCIGVRRMAWLCATLSSHFYSVILSVSLPVSSPYNFCVVPLEIKLSFLPDSLGMEQDYCPLQEKPVASITVTVGA